MRKNLRRAEHALRDALTEITGDRFRELLDSDPALFGGLLRDMDAEQRVQLLRQTFPELAKMVVIRRRVHAPCPRCTPAGTPDVDG